MPQTNILSNAFGLFITALPGPMLDFYIVFTAGITVTLLFLGYRLVTEALGSFTAGASAGAGLNADGSRTVENLYKENLYDGDSNSMNEQRITYRPKGSNHDWNGRSKGTNVQNWGIDAMPRENNFKRLR